MELLRDRDDVTLRLWWGLVLLSLLAHVGVFYTLDKFARNAALEDASQVSPRNVLSTRVLSPQQFAKEERASISASTRPSQQDIKDRARFVSERSQRFEKETRVEPGEFGKNKVSAKPRAPVKSLDKLMHLPGRGIINEMPAELTQSGETMAGVLDKDIAIGSENLLNADEYVYSSFYNRLRDEVGPRWKLLIDQAISKVGRPFPRGSFLTRATIVLDAEGEVLDVILVQSSGIKALDEAARTSIFQTLRFRNPPKMLREKDGNFHVKSQFLLENLGRADFGTTYVPDPRLMPPTRR